MKTPKYTLRLPKGYHKRKLADTSKWVKALRSGRYKQGRNNLCLKDCGPRKYCCLGVRLQIQGNLKVINNGFGYDKYDTEYNDTGGIYDENPDFKILQYNGRFPKGISVEISEINYYDLAELNDSGEFTFEDIADIIEKVYKD